MQEVQDVFKIRNAKGQFASGGRYSSWHYIGKSWDTAENALKHIEYIEREYKDNDSLNARKVKMYNRAKIVRYKLVEEEVISPSKLRKAK
mgnify:CR=1 FL=1